MKIVQFKMIPLFFALSVAWVPYSEAKIKRALVQEPCNQLFDVIIVGAGTAGCVLANRLTEDPTFNVLLIDAGRDDSRLDPILPVDLPDPLPNKANNPWPSFIPR